VTTAIADTLDSVRTFKTSDAYRPTGDQPRAIETLAEALNADDKHTTLVGATGTGKTATMAWTIEQVGKPALVIAHNKTLAAQLCNEFREFFPHNAVEYFVSYYDYYQPEAYVPQADLYIEKDSSQNDDIARLRLAATSALFTRRDVVVVASVSCIYALGSPEEWRERMIWLEVGEEHDRDLFLRKLIDSQYVRNDTLIGRGKFRVKGDVVEVQPANQETAYRISFFGDEVEGVTHFDPLTGEILSKLDNIAIWPATEYVTSKPTVERAVLEIRHELEERVKELEVENKLLEAHRLRQRTEYDIEMLQELGFCNGIENYSRIMEGRAPGTHPFTLLDYFPGDFVVFIDESHQTVPQIGGMYEGDRSRKQTLVDYGFRLPSALDNRPLRFDEFMQKVPQMVFVSATPGPYELRHSKRVAEQLIRPTGIVDPAVELRATKNQIDDLLNEVRRREEAGERVLVTTLTKKMAEDLTDYLLESGVKARYLHSEIDTLERIQIIRELRLGEYDVLVGVNLLREGLDLPEVSLVAILDADKEGFLRGKTALIQTIGRAARNVNGKVLLYADKLTEAIQGALDETNRRRAVQIAYNEEHDITPQTIVKGVSDIAEFLALESPTVPSTKRRRGRKDVEGMSARELEKLVIELEEEMFAAAEELRFEYAAKLRDEIKELRRELAAAETTAAAGTGAAR
jgi:excinuclease ABC subunit B